VSKERKLGRGLEALLGEEPPESHVQELPVSLVIPNPDQPRKHFTESSLSELAESIRRRGVVQPLIVRKKDDGTYDLIAGERRYRAAKMAGLETVPAVVRDYSDQDAAEISLIENLQRENLNPVEEGEAYKYLIRKYKYTQEELADLLGKSRPYVGNMIRVTALPDKFRQLLIEGKATVGQVRPALSFMKGVDMDELAERIVRDNLSARDVEDIVRRKNAGKKAAASRKDGTYAHFRQLEEELKLSLGTDVHIRNGKGKETVRGSISISYGSEEEFRRLVAFLKNEE